jgi:DNA replication protein DnaC
MVTDRQVRRLWWALSSGKTLAQAADKSGMSEKTARKYRGLGRLPSEVAPERTWRTREDRFAEVWPEVFEQLGEAPGLEATTLFRWLQRKYPGRFDDSQLRSFQRGVKRWRATSGPAKEVFFDQVHHPGRLCASDFTHMSGLGVTIGGQPLDHLVYHFVLTYSNWESVTICFSESFESLSEGFQNAVWELGGVAQRHRTDRMSLAVNNATDEKEFTQRYQGLLGYYGVEAEKIQADEAHENGDAEQSHRRFKEAVEQALLLRGSRDFESREAYVRFLGEVVASRNAGRRKRLEEELPLLRRLPERRRESYKRVWARVGRGSLIRVDRNTYSVPSRLIGERVEVRLYVEHVEVWYAQREVERFPRLRGRKKHAVNYRHIIDWLVRKPGAFADYRYREDLFPTSRLPTFRECFEELARRAVQETASYEQYLLELAERECQARWTKRTERLLRQSRLPLDKDLASFEMRRLPAKVARQVRTLLEGSFVDRRENLLLFGKTGTGKTHLLSAIAQELVRSGRKVISWPCALLVQELLVAKRDLKLSRVLKRLSKYEALLIDDIGYVQQSREEMEVLFTLLAERYERGTVMLTSNLPFSKWEAIFKDPMTTAAAIDRLVHHSVILELNIPSYRLEEAKRTKGKDAA